MAKKDNGASRDDEGDAVIACTFGGFSKSGKGTIAIGVTIERARLTTAVAAKLFCDTRFTCSLKKDADAAKDDPKQTKMFAKDADLQAVADCHRVSMGADTYTMRLSFKGESLSKSQRMALADLAGEAGINRMDDIERIPDEERQRDDDQSQQSLSDEAGAAG